MPSFCSFIATVLLSLKTHQSRVIQYLNLLPFSHSSRFVLMNFEPGFILYSIRSFEALQYCSKVERRSFGMCCIFYGLQLSRRPSLFIWPLSSFLAKIISWFFKPRNQLDTNFSVTVATWFAPGIESTSRVALPVKCSGCWASAPASLLDAVLISSQIFRPAFSDIRSANSN